MKRFSFRLVLPYILSIIVAIMLFSSELPSKILSSASSWLPHTILTFFMDEETLAQKENAELNAIEQSTNNSETDPNEPYDSKEDHISSEDFTADEQMLAIQNAKELEQELKNVKNEPQVYEENPRYTIEQDEQGQDILRSVVQKGDTAGKILGDWFSANDIVAIIAAAKPEIALTNIRLDQDFFIVRDAENQEAMAFGYQLDKMRTLMVQRDGASFSAKVEEVAYTTELAAVSGDLSTNLVSAVLDTGEGIGFAIALANVFGSEINFVSETRVGDRFEALVEKRSVDGKFLEYGRILSARYINEGKPYEAYLFRNTQGNPTYYNSKGESLNRAILKSPLSFLRVTSKYTMRRKHPITGVVRPHQGIDYGAPSGTPIMAVGSGVVTLAAWNGGYGKQVIIKHSNGLESMYAHMSRYGKGIRKGVRVRQGQTIGYVGSTGLSTGPHLDFRIKQHGKFVNPNKLVVPRDPGVSRKNMAEFQETVDHINKLWSDETAVAGYSPDSILGEQTKF